MKYSIDKELEAHIMQFDSIADMIKHTAANQSKDNWTALESGSFDENTGFTDFNQVKDRIRESWHEGALRVRSIIDSIMRLDVPLPRSRRRRGSWSEVDGTEICVDRWQSGQEYWRTARRQTTSSNPTVCLMTNLDACASDNNSDIFWRGAGACAIADILENAGYNVEMNIWLRGRRVFDNVRGQFTTMTVKSAGDVLNMSTIVNTLSSWFLRNLVFSSFCVADDKNSSLGSAEQHLGEFQRHMEVEGDHVVFMPLVRDAEETIKAVHTILRVFNDGCSGMTARDWQYQFESDDLYVSCG